MLHTFDSLTKDSTSGILQLEEFLGCSRMKCFCISICNSEACTHDLSCDLIISVFIVLFSSGLPEMNSSRRKADLPQEAHAALDFAFVEVRFCRLES